MRLAAKRAIVTGSGAGIGRAIAELFAREGAKILVAEIEEPNGRETVERIRAAGGTAEFERVDVASQDDCRRMAAAARRHFDGVDILVNNAAAFVFRRVEQATREDWDKALGTNVVGPAMCVASVLDDLKRAGRAAVVNVASVSGMIAQKDFVPYNSSKGALLQLTRCLAMDLAEWNIRVNAVCPGAIRTRATDGHIATLGLDREQAYRDFGRDAVLQRMGEPIEVAYAALFLASDEASFVTGANLVVDGGAIID